MRTKHGSKETLEFTRHGLYRKPKPMNKLDGRRREVRAWKVFIAGITADLGGELSFAQKALAEICFWKYYALSEFMRALLLSRKDRSVLALITSERHNRQFNCTSNSLRGDLKEIYGPAGLGKVERRVQSLQDYLQANYGEEN